MAVLRALTAEESEILAIAPYFPEYKPFCEANGVNFKVVPPDVPTFQINLQVLESMLTGQTQAVILMDTDHVILSGLTTETLAARWEGKQGEKENG